MRKTKKDMHSYLSPTKHRHILRPTIYLYLIRGLTCMIKPYSFAHLRIPYNTFSCFFTLQYLNSYISKLGIFLYIPKHSWPSKSILHESLTQKQTILATTHSVLSIGLHSFFYSQVLAIAISSTYNNNGTHLETWCNKSMPFAFWDNSHFLIGSK